MLPLAGQIQRASLPAAHLQRNRQRTKYSHIEFLPEVRTLAQWKGCCWIDRWASDGPLSINLPAMQVQMLGDGMREADVLFSRILPRRAGFARSTAHMHLYQRHGRQHL